MLNVDIQLGRSLWRHIFPQAGVIVSSARVTCFLRLRSVVLLKKTHPQYQQPSVGKDHVLLRMKRPRMILQHPLRASALLPSGPGERKPVSNTRRNSVASIASAKQQMWVNATAATRATKRPRVSSLAMHALVNTPCLSAPPVGKKNGRACVSDAKHPKRERVRRGVVFVSLVTTWLLCDLVSATVFATTVSRSGLRLL